MGQVEYEKATRTYPGEHEVRAVDSLDLTIEQGEFLVLVGPSGSGKSTALRMLAGLEKVTEGRILIGGRDVTNVPPRDRDIAMVFQSYALYPQMSVAENMGFALKIRKVAKSEIDERVRAAAGLLDLTKYLDRRPKDLSGGQRQRVAMGRAIVRDPAVFLMDEPLSNLDAKLRVETRANIKALQSRLATTTVYVTHDQVEAMTMGHRVAVLKDGVLQQCDEPRNLYRNPKNSFIAAFIGSPGMNLNVLPISDDSVGLGGLNIRLPRDLVTTAHSARLESINVGVRPEHLSLTTETSGTAEMVVDLVEELGSDSFVYGTVRGAGRDHRLVVRAGANNLPGIGDPVQVRINEPDTLHYFNPESGERISA